jgi:hypothetical protein
LIRRQVFFEQRGNLVHERAIVKLGAWFAIQPPLLAQRLSLIAGVNAASPVPVYLAVYAALVLAEYHRHIAFGQGHARHCL